MSDGVYYYMPKIISTDSFIKEAKEVHNNLYSYNKTKYINSVSKIIVLCKLHGYFKISPANHLRGRGCQECGKFRQPRPKAGQSLKEKFPTLIIEWSEKNELNSENYGCCSGYRAWWKCSRCNYEWQTRIVTRTQYSSGCPKCKTSKGELAIETWLKNHDFTFKSQYKTQECKNKRMLPFDFAVWIDSKLILIEFNGEQHYNIRKTGLFSNQEKFAQIQANDIIKVNFCKSKNIPLLVISYKQLSKIDEIIPNFILHQITSNGV